MADPAPDMTIADAADAFSGLLAREEKSERTTPAGKAAADEPETDEALEPPETPAEVEEPDAEGGNRETAEPDEDPEEGNDRNRSTTPSELTARNSRSPWKNFRRATPARSGSVRAARRWRQSARPWRPKRLR